MAASEVTNVQYTGVTVPDLEALKAVMYSSSPDGMYMSKSEVRKELMPTAYHQVEPATLKLLYEALYVTARWTSSQSKAAALNFAKFHIDPNLVVTMYHSIRSARVHYEIRDELLINLTEAGADASQWYNVYKRTNSLHEAQVTACINALDGISRRYMPDGTLQTAREAHTALGDAAFFDIWLISPREKRIGSDGFGYYDEQFQQNYGTGWTYEWMHSKEEPQVRVGKDDAILHTIQDFRSLYPDSWQQEWSFAPEKYFKQHSDLGPCDTKNYADCMALGSECVWKWTGNKRTSCKEASPADDITTTTTESGPFYSDFTV
eukprot:CAMPEP_0194479822 /NCGR_PEP_ID=MMETSP0253-20130528/2830_1 /TAXON_ID=2966 /ORGANISM="Noctiluca scintillans" /LENGTH=319 /DNA_ID=CAMNT_0039319111 /DNA_START=179 /DNA_END=1138 /DNA_ORIENTATION=-